LLSVIIVNYNVKYFLEQCLHSVQKAIAGIPGEIIVVDNHSTDGSLAYLLPLFPSVQFIANAGNPGFSKANNQGWRMAKGDHILFLNPDTLLSEDCLQQSLALMEQRPDTGALGIRMVDGSGQYLPESKRGTPTPAVSFYKLSGLIRLFPKSPVFARYYLGHLSATEDHEVEVLAGAYMLVRRSVLEATSGFDERFFMYGEDVDLSYRIRQLGYKNRYLAGSSIIHFKGESAFVCREIVFATAQKESPPARFIHHSRHKSGCRWGCFHPGAKQLPGAGGYYNSQHWQTPS
jgi:GT2 family glycosyltransferase